MSDDALTALLDRIEAIQERTEVIASDALAAKAISEALALAMCSMDRSSRNAVISALIAAENDFHSRVVLSGGAKDAQLQAAVEKVHHYRLKLAAAFPPDKHEFGG